MPNIDHPNVLYIITHDQGIAASCYHDYGVDGIISPPTPNLDRVAISGALLSQHFCTFPMCSPARGSLMTSQFPHQNGLNGLTHRGFALKDGINTVVHQFQKSGYRTMLLGLQHETNDPKLLGYQEILASSFYSPWIYLSDDIEDVFQDLAHETRPWWLTLGLEELHRPWRPKADPVDSSTINIPKYLPDTPEVRDDLAEFVGALKSYDNFIGFILTLMEKHQLSQNTLIIVTTDHGIAIPRAKGTLYDSGIQTLMMWSYPSRIPACTVLSDLVSGIDFAPTICDFCHVPPSDTFKGTSYAKLLENPQMDSSQKPKLPEFIYVFHANSNY
jgi:arylsulfatase A-like enzyme